MADITTRYSGDVESSGKVNWRGDQVSVPQGGQSVYKSSSIKLAELGSRKVVGDRVFRYAKASGSAGAGDICESNVETLDSVTCGAAVNSGAKTFTWYAATAMAKDTYAEGYLFCQSGTAANMGQFYRIKSHATTAGTSDVTLHLYDELKLTSDVVDEWAIQQNPYSRCIEATTGAGAASIGVAPIAVTTNDYFWLQTWGPCAMKAGTAAAMGEMLVTDATGQSMNNDVSSAPAANGLAEIGHALHTQTASQYGLSFLTIAP